MNPSIINNLNPFQKSITNGISVVTVVKNRTKLLLKALDTWLTHKEVDEIIILDWSSDESLIPIIESYNNKKITLAVVENQPKWILTYAFNLAIRLATKDKILKVDADIKVFPGFFKEHILSPGTFYTGYWKNARNNNERHLNGTMYLYNKDFFEVNGYNEYITSYGWDDSDLYERIKSKGKIQKYLNNNYVHHIEHDNRTTHQKATDFIKGLDDYERSTFNILLNTLICTNRERWSVKDKMLDFRIEILKDSIIKCYQKSKVTNIISKKFIEKYEILAIRERLKHFNITFNDKIVNKFTRDELNEIYKMAFSKKSNYDDEPIFRFFMKYNNEIEKEVKSLIKNELFFQQKDQKIKQQSEELQNHKEWLVQKDQKIKQQSEELQNTIKTQISKEEKLNKSLNEKDNLIRQQKQLFFKIKREKNQLNLQLKSRNEVLDQLTGSLSWKVTKPLRFLKSFF